MKFSIHPLFRIVCAGFLTAAVVSAFTAVYAQDIAKTPNPADRLPPHIRRATLFGERADWSHDGKKILFIEKTYGDAFEVELSTGAITPVTHHYPHGGYTRALYLANGDILLSGSTSFDATNPHLNRSEKAELWILDKSLTKPPVRLGEKCSEGPAVSRKRLRIAWAIVAAQYPDKLKPGQSQMWMANLEYSGSGVKLANKKLVLDSITLPFKATLEPQNFRPPEENELTFSAYGYQGTDAMGVVIDTGKLTNYSKAPNQYDEPEGIFPDGEFTLVECDRQNGKGSSYVDLWKLRLDGSSQLERLTYFSDTPGYKASNGVISDDGRFLAFQMARSRDPAGVGYGIFIYDLEKAQATLGRSENAAYRVVPEFPRLPPGWSLGAVSGVTTDKAGNVVVFHRGQHPILVFDRDGNYLRSFGDGLFTSAHGLRVDSDDNIWVTDNGNHTVTKFNREGKILLTLGEKDKPGEDESHFNKPTDIAFAPDGDFYVSDGYGNSRVVKFDRSGKFLLTWGKKGKGAGEFDLPHAVRLDRRGQVYVADRENNRIQVFDGNGKFIRQFSGFAPFGLFITSDQSLFVADGRAHKALKMTLDGKVLTTFGTQGAQPGQFDLPHGITVAADGAVYVTDITGKRVQKFVAK